MEPKTLLTREPMMFIAKSTPFAVLKKNPFTSILTAPIIDVFRSFTPTLAPTICSWVSEDGLETKTNFLQELPLPVIFDKSEAGN